MHWHCVEHIPCALWARAEHAFCTCRARADASRPWPCHHCRATPLAPLSPQHAKQSLATSPTGQELAATAIDSPCSVQRHPSLSRSPPGPWNSTSSSTSMSTSARRRHDALATEWRSPATLSAATVGTDPDRLFKEPRARLRTKVASSGLQEAPSGSQSTREGLLPRVRSVRPPPSSGRFCRHQWLPLSILSTKSSPSLS